MNTLASPTVSVDSASLREQLIAAGRFDAEYGDGLSSHLPMTLVALARLGADDATRRAFADRYAQQHRLHAAPPIEPWPAGDAWTSRLGDPAAWPVYRALFRDWIAHEGAADALAQALPMLAQGCAAAAFHGPIRVAYALAANHADELADALAYWACRWFSCGAPALRGGRLEPARVLAALDFAADLAPAPLIALRMMNACTDPRFAAAAARLRLGPATLPGLAALAAARYADDADFTVLHLVTGAHAALVLLPWFDDDAARAQAQAYVARAFMAAWATRPSPPRLLPPAPSLDWQALTARAIASDDEHVIKLVDSCRELERMLGGDAWRRAASRASGS
jgi:hypothetical protein